MQIGSVSQHTGVVSGRFAARVFTVCGHKQPTTPYYAPQHKDTPYEQSRTLTATLRLSMTSYYRAARSSNSAATTLDPDGEATQLGNQPLLFAFLPLLHGCMTENLIRVGNVGHDVTVLCASLLLPAHKAEKKVVFSKEFTLQSFIKGVCGF